MSSGSYAAAPVNAGVARPRRLDEVNELIQVHNHRLEEIRGSIQGVVDRLLGSHPTPPDVAKNQISPVMCSVDTLHKSLEEQVKLIDDFTQLLVRLQEL